MIEYSNKISGEVSKKISYEDITNKIINLFETEDKNKNLSDKLNKTDIFFEKIIINGRNDFIYDYSENLLENEIKNENKELNDELELL